MKDFYFTRKERRGLTVLMICVATVLAHLYFYVKFDLPDEVDFVEIEIDSSFEEEYQATQNKTYRGERKGKTQSKVTEKAKGSPASDYKKPWFEFDPNLTSGDSLQKLPIDEKAINNLQKYRSKGGQFKNVEDLLKIYSMDAPRDSLQKYMKLENGEHSNISNDKSSRDSLQLRNLKNEIREVEIHFVDANRADTLELQMVKGIGPAYARRIVDYRESLGGFVSSDQLYEVWGIPQDVMAEILPHLLFPPFEVRKLSVNSEDEENLGTHPYLKRKKAGILVRYRENHGPFSKLSDLRKVKVINESELEKLKPYLDFETDQKNLLSDVGVK